MGSPISVLRFSRLATVRRRWREHRGEDVLGRGLADRAGDPDHGAAQRAPPRGGQALQGRERVVGRDHGSGPRAARRVGVLGRRPAPPTRRRPAPAPRSARRRRARRPARRRGRRAPTARESITARAGRRRAAPGATSRPPAACGDLLRRPRAHAAPRGRRRRRRRAPCGRPRTPGSCSWPLPATTTTSPGAARRDGALDGRAAIDASRSRRRGAPCGDLGHDRLGVLAARVVGGDDRHVGAARPPRAPISGRLPRSRSPPAPKTTISRPRVSSRAVRSAVLQGVGLVRVVDDDREGLALVDGLEAPGHAPGAPAAPRGDRRVVDAQRARHDDRAERVEDVEAARQRRAQLEPVDREGRAARVGASTAVARTWASGASRPMRIALGKSRGQARAVGVVDVDRPRSSRPGLEQPPLGQEVVLHVGVEVEVVLREVGEDRRRPVDGVGAVQGERVARDLHDDRVVAGGEHVGEGALQVDRLGRGARHGVLLAADDRGHGAEQAGRRPARLEQRAHEEGRRRLAVGAGDPDRGQPRGRVAGQRGGGGRHRGAHVVDEDLRHARCPAGAARRAPPRRARSRRRRSRGRRA